MATLTSFGGFNILPLATSGHNYTYYLIGYGFSPSTSVKIYKDRLAPAANHATEDDVFSTTVVTDGNGDAVWQYQTALWSFDPIDLFIHVPSTSIAVADRATAAFSYDVEDLHPFDPYVTVDGLVATPGDEEVDLVWNPGVAVDALGTMQYTVRRSTSAVGGYVTVASGLVVENYTDTGLTNGLTYYYKVVATVLIGGVSIGESLIGGGRNESNVVSAMPDSVSPALSAMVAKVSVPRT